MSPSLQYTGSDECRAYTDDILNYIGPSLKKHQGCDIIDIHPGACIWSQKLHNFLKPRRHLLMEPETKYLKNFVQPLLDEPDSKYRHTTMSGAHPKSYFSVYQSIFEDENLLPKREALAINDPRRRQPNNTLLVTGTLSRRYKTHRGHEKNVHTANLLLSHFLQASQTNSLFHRYGLVRMLLWQPEDVRPNVLPDYATSRGALAASLDMAAEMVEVAGSDRAATGDQTELRRTMIKHRYPVVDQVSASRVLKRMKSSGISLPVHRQPLLHQKALEQDAAGEVGQSTVPLWKWQEKDALRLPDGVELEDAIKEHEEKCTKFLQSLMHGKRRKLDVPYQFEFSGFLAQSLTPLDKSRLGPYMDLWAWQLVLEAEVVRRKSGQELVDRVKGTLGQVRAMHEARTMAAQYTKSLVANLQNELHAFHTEPAVLAHDRRPFEVLRSSAEEFWPQFNMFLLDIQPRAETIAENQTATAEATAELRQMITTLWQLHAKPVTKALDRVGPNAAHDLLPSVPDVLDAVKGGRLDPEEVLVRMLSRDMLTKLTLACLDWPFHPNNPQIDLWELS